MVYTAGKMRAVCASASFLSTVWVGMAVAAPVIDWRVEQPFRFFSDPRDTEVHRLAYLSLPENQRQTAVLAAERGLAQKYKDGWAANRKGKTCWDGDRVKNLCPKDGTYIKPSRHTIIARVGAGGDQVPAGEKCLWRFEAAALPQRARKGKAMPVHPLVDVERSCGESVSFEVPYPGGGHLSLLRDGNIIATSEIRVTDLFVVGMGDSFASGEGNPDVPVRFASNRAVTYGNLKKSPQLGGYPARVGRWSQIGDAEFIKNNAVWLDQACHRSVYSHQLRTALQLSVEDPHRAVTFLGLACSGAQVVDGLFLRYKGHEWVPDPPILSQISAVASAQCEGYEAPLHDLPEAYHINGQVPALQGLLKLHKCEATKARKIDLMMVSIGGNDVGFARLVANAVLPSSSTLRTLGGWLGQVQDEDESMDGLVELKARYKSLNRALHFILHIPWDEADRVVLTGYPPLALLDDGRSMCPDGNAGMDVISEFALIQTRAKSSDAVAKQLHRSMNAASREHNWSFVEAHREKFLGRGICAGYLDSAFSSVDDLRLPRFVDGDWEPYNPANYLPYASRQRWFRTPNDAFLTGNFHVSTSLFRTVAKQVQNLQWMQLLLAATYSGAFHPTAEGQAAIADATLARARAVLSHHGQGQRGDPFAWRDRMQATAVLPSPLPAGGAQ